MWLYVYRFGIWHPTLLTFHFLPLAPLFHFMPINHGSMRMIRTKCFLDRYTCLLKTGTNTLWIDTLLIVFGPLKFLESILPCNSQNLSWYLYIKFPSCRFYPGTGSEVNRPLCSYNPVPGSSQLFHVTPSNNIVNICLTPIGPGPWDNKARLKLLPKQRQILQQTASKEMREKVTKILVPSLSAFSPDLLIISAG